MIALSARDFPPGTPLHHFFAWNEAAWFPDRRHRLWRTPGGPPQRLAALLGNAVGNPDIAAHAAVFAAWEELGPPARQGPRRILVIRLSAFGDFVQALGPFAAIRRHHAADHITLLTTQAFAAFAGELGYFDEVLVDHRPSPLALPRWLALRRQLRRRRFDRVYDLQTSHRSAAYAWLLRPGLPQWSGTAWHCSHPHANRDRARQHTLDKQAEQLLMAGIHPTPLPELPPLRHELPSALRGRRFVLIAPGSSPGHPEKRWPIENFAALAAALADRLYLPVLVGTAAETPLGEAVAQHCPAAVDLVGRTDLGLLGALAQHAALAIGNDTGACHLAAAAGCPVIVLFSRASDPARCAPRGRVVRIVREPNLQDLPAQTVIDEARTLLCREPISTVPSG